MISIVSTVWELTDATDVWDGNPIKLIGVLC